MMIAEASTEVAAPLERLRAVVLDPASYAAADTKVIAIHIEEQTAAGMVARIDGHLGPFRSWIRVRYVLSPRRVDLIMLQGRLRGFHACFLFEPLNGKVRLTHREEYDFGYGPLTRLVEFALHRWAVGTVRAEVEALRRAAESGPER